MILKRKDFTVEIDITEDIESGYYDKNNIENFYHDDMFNKDLYIHCFEGELYIIDSSTQKVYDLPYITFNNFLEKLYIEKEILLYPYEDNIVKDIIEDFQK